MTTKTVECPKCGLNRAAALDNHRAGDPTAFNLLNSCSECRKWAANPNPYQSVIDTALAGILSILQDDLHGSLDSTEMGIPAIVAGIRAVLEALVEDVSDQERKYEQT